MARAGIWHGQPTTIIMAFINRRPTQKRPFKSLTAATTLTETDSGRVYGLAAAGGFTVTLPAVAEGVSFTFIVTVAPTTAYIIAGAAGDLIHVTAHSSTGGNAASSAGNPVDAVNFAASVALIGDKMEFFCDGTYWYCQAFSDADAGITVTDA
jgi:hypothetical protein